MNSGGSPRDICHSQRSPEWKLSSTEGPLSTQPRDGHEETDWNSDWLTDGVAIRLQSLHRPGVPASASGLGPYTTTGGQGDRLHDASDVQRFSYQDDESDIGVIPEERCDSRTSQDHDQWLEGPKQHEAVSGLIQRALWLL